MRSCSVKTAAYSQSNATDPLHNVKRMSGRAVPERNQHLIEFGSRIRDLREARRLSKEQLAHAAGLHRTVVGFIERGDREVGISKVWALAAALGVPAAELFT